MLVMGMNSRGGICSFCHWKLAVGGHHGFEAVRDFEVVVLTQVVVVGEVHGLMVVAVPERGEHGGDVGAVVAAWEALGVGDVGVALDASVLRHLHVFPAGHGVDAVVVALIVAEECAAEL